MRDYPSIAVMREDICQVYLWHYGEKYGPYEWKPMSKITDEDIIQVLWETAVYRMMPAFIKQDSSEILRPLSELPEQCCERRLLRLYYLHKLAEEDIEERDTQDRDFWLALLQG